MNSVGQQIFSKYLPHFKHVLTYSKSNVDPLSILLYCYFSCIQGIPVDHLIKTPTALYSSSHQCLDFVDSRKN